MHAFTFYNKKFERYKSMETQHTVGTNNRFNEA